MCIFLLFAYIKIELVIICLKDWGEKTSFFLIYYNYYLI